GGAGPLGARVAARGRPADLGGARRHRDQRRLPAESCSDRYHRFTVSPLPRWGAACSLCCGDGGAGDDGPGDPARGGARLRTGSRPTEAAGCGVITMISEVAGTGIAIVLAVLGAACFAGAAVLQHGAVTAGSHREEDDQPGKVVSLRGLREITRRPGWLAGLALAGTGSALHATALVLAPLSVVQPLGVLAVPLAVLLTAMRTDRTPAAGVVVGVLLTIAGVAVFVGAAAGTAVSSPPPGQAT